MALNNMSNVILILCIVPFTLSGFIYYRKSSDLPVNQCNSPSSCIEIFKCPTLFQSYSPKSILFFNFKIFKKNSFCGFRRYVPQVCCQPTEKSTEYPKNEIVNHKNFELLPMDICGEVSSRFRITSGVGTSPGEFPWMALIAYRTGGALEDREFKCAGTLITDLYVLTAAHCIFNTTMFGVRLGEHNLLTEIDCDPNGQNCEYPNQDLLINKTTIHPLYDPSSYINDIALIKLAKPANYSYGCFVSKLLSKFNYPHMFVADNVKPICLPFGNLLHVNLENQELTVAGWGATENGGTSMVLRKVSVPVISMKDCKKQYEEFKPISKRQICAGADKGRDSCAGDSGGPLKRVEMVNHSPRYVQYGIVSYGPTRCGISGRSGIYTNVREYMEWILDNLEPNLNSK